MADIKHLLDKIRTAIYGKEVRGSLADGLQAVNDESEDAKEISVNVEQRQDAVEEQFDDVLSEWSDDREVDNAETIAARTNRETGNNYKTLGNRLDDENKKVTQQLSGTAQELQDTKTETEKNIRSLRGTDLELLKEQIKSNPNVVNMVKNGNFKENTDNWEEFIGASIEKVPEGMKIIGTGTSRFPRVRQNIGSSYDVGDVIYLYTNFIAETNKSNTFGYNLYGDDDNNTILVSFQDYRPFEYATFSESTTIPKEFVGDLRLQTRINFSTSADADGESFVVNNIVALNLTTIFGKGNEPSDDDMQLIVEDVFDGFIPKEREIYLNPNLISRLKSIDIRKKPLVAVTLDDNFSTDYNTVFPELQSRGIKATSYVIGSRVGDSGRLTWEQIHELKNAGWTIGCHSNTHPQFANLTDQEIKDELQAVDDAFLANGLAKPRHHSLPYGSGRGDQRVMDIVSQYRKTIRQTGGKAYNDYDDFNLLDLYGKQVDINDSNMSRLNLRKSDIDATVRNNGFLILYGHEQFPKGSNVSQDYQGIITNFLEVVDYAASKDVEFVTMEELYQYLLDYQLFTS